ncbi:MAG TPA: phosphotransferase [Bryobacteraceae bacterium]|nr:phosphotransferase [Bryobacteraceae bacterium]
MPETLDIEDTPALIAWLRQTGRLAADEQPRVRNLAGGVSNRTVWLERASGEAWVLKQALAKLRVPVDWFSSPERIHREALGLEWLARLAPPGTITPLLFADRGQHLLAMQAVPRPHENWKAVLLAGRICGDHVRQFAGLLATIHRQARGRGDVAEVFADRSFFESLRLEPYYAYSAQQTPAAAGFLEALMRDTRETRTTLVHGDYSPKNVLIHAGRLVLLDHEVIHYGDPAFDLGFALTHFLSKAHHLPACRSQFLAAAQEFWDTYTDAAGADAEARAVRHTLGCLLARVAGRSPLEYLSVAERLRQRDAVLRIMPAAPPRIADLIGMFGEELCR